MLQEVPAEDGQGAVQQFINLEGRRVVFQDGMVHLPGTERSAKVLSEELWYDEEFREVRVVVISAPIAGEMLSVLEEQAVNALPSSSVLGSIEKRFPVAVSERSLRSHLDYIRFILGPSLARKAVLRNPALDYFLQEASIKATQLSPKTIPPLARRAQETVSRLFEESVAKLGKAKEAQCRSASTGVLRDLRMAIQCVVMAQFHNRVHQAFSTAFGENDRQLTVWRIKYCSLSLGDLGLPANMQAALTTETVRPALERYEHLGNVRTPLQKLSCLRNAFKALQRVVKIYNDCEREKLKHSRSSWMEEDPLGIVKARVEEFANQSANSSSSYPAFPRPSPSSPSSSSLPVSCTVCAPPVPWLILRIDFADKGGCALSLSISLSSSQLPAAPLDNSHDLASCPQPRSLLPLHESKFEELVISTDDLLPILIYFILHSELKHVHADVAFIEHCGPSPDDLPASLHSELGYLFASYKGALSYLSTGHLKEPPPVLKVPSLVKPKQDLLNDLFGEYDSDGDDGLDTPVELKDFASFQPRTPKFQLAKAPACSPTSPKSPSVSSRVVRSEGIPQQKRTRRHTTAIELRKPTSQPAVDLSSTSRKKGKPQTTRATMSVIQPQETFIQQQGHSNPADRTFSEIDSFHNPSFPAPFSSPVRNGLSAPLAQTQSNCRTHGPHQEAEVQSAASENDVPEGLKLGELVGLSPGPKASARNGKLSMSNQTTSTHIFDGSLAEPRIRVRVTSSYGPDPLGIASCITQNWTSKTVKPNTATERAARWALLVSGEGLEMLGEEHSKQDNHRKEQLYSGNTNRSDDDVGLFARTEDHNWDS
eukprot:g82208.t1